MFYIIMLWDCKIDFIVSGLLRFRSSYSIFVYWIFNFVVVFDFFLYMYLSGKLIIRWYMVIFIFCMEGF